MVDSVKGSIQNAEQSHLSIVVFVMILMMLTQVIITH